VEVIPGIESLVEDLSFKWNVTSEKASEMTINLYFDHPLRVSANAIPDTVKVFFNDPTLFMGANGLKMESKGYIIESRLPKQQPSVDFDISGASSSAKAIVIGNFILNIMMSASLQQLWNMINAQQLVVMLPLFDI
jgi:hypothetical protein